MNDRRLKILLIVEACNPEWSSVPLVGYRFFHAISQLADVTLVTHERNRSALEKLNEAAEIVYVRESWLMSKYYHYIVSLASKTKVIWQLYHALGFPIYAEFNNSVYQKFKDKIRRGEYDLVHAMTPMEPRYPVKTIKACTTTPFVLGPVNGGVPFPPGFRQIAKREFAALNFLRTVGRVLIPGYAETYKRASRVLAGSTYTLNLVKGLFNLSSDRLELFYENGVLSSFQPLKQVAKGNVVNLLFVGRLVPYKCADVLVEAISRLDRATQARVRLAIVGDGEERANLEQLTRTLQLEGTVHFSGWVTQDEILKYYQEADLFCFPSIREFGGAVVLEAMVCGLPCIVANNGGIGEYVTDETGVRIEPTSREYLTEELSRHIKRLVEDEPLRRQMSERSIDRMREFTWEAKAKRMIRLYEDLVLQRQPALPHR
ncbi:MAG TPA: glycosyltransferase family 4 protein [Thermosynechococcaceae cyanobacterium]